MTEQIHDGAGAEQLGEELREFLSALVSAAAPLVAQVAPGPDAPEASCTWCPVCALVALSRGEQHPLLTALGSSGVTLLTVLRDLIADSVNAHGTEGGAAHPDGKRGATGSGHGGAGAGSDGPAASGSAGPAGDRTGSAGVGGSAVPLRFERIPVSVSAETGRTGSAAPAAKKGAEGAERAEFHDGAGRVP